MINENKLIDQKKHFKCLYKMENLLSKTTMLPLTPRPEINNQNEFKIILRFKRHPPYPSIDNDALNAEFASISNQPSGYFRPTRVTFGNLGIPGSSLGVLRQFRPSPVLMNESALFFQVKNQTQTTSLCGN